MGQIHKLYIPVKNKYMDNIVISEIYNDDGDFVGHELEKELNEELYKIESSDWYVDKISEDNRTIYKKENVDFIKN